MSSKRLDRDPAFSFDGDTTLRCPGCGDDFLHQCSVDVFVRDAEDENRGEHVSVDYRNGVERTSDASQSAGNPSNRRDGIKIGFTCETCGDQSEPGPDYVLVISQHKGNEEISWEAPENGLPK